MVLSQVDGGPVLVRYGSKDTKKTGAMLRVAHHDCALSFKDSEGTVRTALSFEGGQPYACFCDVQGNVRAILGLDKDGNPNFDTDR